MKRKSLLIISFFLLTKLCFGTPSNSISIPNSFSPNTTISSSEVNSNFNEGQTKFNAHSHTDITQTGTITSGTWQGTVIDEQYGGTGSNFSATAQGNIFYFSGTGTVATLAPGTANQVLKTGGAGANPSWTNQAPDANTLDTYNTATTATASSIYVSGADGYLPDATVDTTALKTATVETSHNTTTWTYITLPGGSYGFFPQIKTSGANPADRGMTFAEINTANLPSSYTTTLLMYANGGTIHAQQTYLTASGKDLWVFLLIDKTTKEIISAYQAPDHPAYGNGGDFDKVSHPFGSYDETKHEIILLDKETCLAIKAESEQNGKSILTLVNEDYKPNMDKEEVYQPLHSGRFLNAQPELLQSIPNYIKVRKLIKLTQAEKDIKQQKFQQAIEKAKQDKIKKEQNKINAKNKLKALGLTDEEINELIK